MWLPSNSARLSWGKRLALLRAQQLGPFEFPLSCFRALGGSRRLGI